MFKALTACRLLDFLSSLHFLLQSNLGHSACDSNALGITASEIKVAALTLLSPLLLKSHTAGWAPALVTWKQKELNQWEHAEKEEGGMSVTGW